jgi:hypothetical protein
VPQPPQLFGSICVFVHAPLQSVLPVGHASEQVPIEQTRPVMQTVLHDPQLNGSICSFTHTPLHTVVPVGQAEHAPAVQV